jgi:peptide/nickel transport system substrate-binding protein
MEVEILGQLVIRRGGHEVAVSAPKQRLLLLLLLLRRGELVPTETLIDTLWTGAPPATVVKVVQVYVSQLRKVLGDGTLETCPGGYRLHIEAAAVDSERFEQLLAQGLDLLASGNPSGAEAVLRAALVLWRGPPLAEFRFEAFAAQEIGRLEELRLLARAKRLEAELALGRAAESVAELQALVREYPLQENLRHLLMLALYRAGRQADALAAYQAARSTLIADLGIDPGESLQRLEAAILAHDPSLELEAKPPDAPAPALRQAPLEERTAPRPAARRINRARRWLAWVGAAALVAVYVVIVLSPGGESSRATQLSAGSVSFIDARGVQLGSQVVVNGQPTAVTVGAGAVWVVDATAGTVARIDPNLHAVVQTIRVGSNPSGLAANERGVWVANHDDATVSWISPETNAVVRTIAVGAGPVAVTYAFDSVWVTNSEDRTLTRINVDTGDVSATIRTNAVGRGVAAGGGSVWVTDEATRGVVQVNPATNAVTATAAVGTGPTSIAFGAGSVWVVNALDATVSSLDPTTRVVQATIPVPGGPSAVSVAGDAVWVSAEHGSRIVRIDPHRDVVVGSAPVGNRPGDLAASGAGVWVTVQASSAGHRGGRLIVLGDGIDSIDPGVAGVPMLNFLAYDGLTSLRHAGGSAGTQIVPNLAATIPQPTADGRSYTFQLRSGIRYSDGTPLRAADFRLGLQRMLEFGGPLAATFTHIVGSQSCLAHRACDLSSGVVPEGATIVTFRLSTPDQRLLEELTFLTPVPAGTPMRDVATKPIPATGPYAIQTYVPGKLLTFERNHYFRVWSAAARPDGYPDEVDYRVVADQDAATRTLLAGQADVVSASHESRLFRQFIAQHPLQVHVDAEQATVFMFLNVRQPPFNDVRVRRAVNYAVDRAHVAALTGTTFAEPTCQLVPPTISGYRPYCPYTIEPDPTGRWKAPDLAKAESLIGASGTKGQTIVVWAFADYVTQARYLVGLLNRLGYKARLHYVPDDATYFAELDKAPATQAGMFGWFGDVLAVDALSVIGCNFDPNPAHFCDHGVDGQLRRLAEAEPANPAGSAGLAETVDHEITDSAPWVPLFTPTYADLISTRVGNYQVQAGQVMLDQLWVR